MKKTYWFLDGFNAFYQTCRLNKIELTAKEKKEFEEKYPNITLYKKEFDAWYAQQCYEQD